MTDPRGAGVNPWLVTIGAIAASLLSVFTSAKLVFGPMLREEMLHITVQALEAHIEGSPSHRNFIPDREIVQLIGRLDDKIAAQSEILGAKLDANKAATDANRSSILQLSTRIEARDK